MLLTNDALRFDAGKFMLRSEGVLVMKFRSTPAWSQASALRARRPA